MEVIKPEFLWQETKQSHKNLTQENLCSGRNWTQTALEYNSDTIPSPPTCSFRHTKFSLFKEDLTPTVRYFTAGGIVS